MNKKRIILIVILAITIIITCIYLINNKYSFELNSKNKYRIETDMKWHTMQNDGGSNTNVYYNIDLDNNNISKVEEIYQANLSGKPKTTINIIYKKEIDYKFQKELKSQLDEIIEKEDVNETQNYHHFTISIMNYEKLIYNENTIETISSMLRKIDQL